MALADLSTSGGSLKRGDRGDNVRELQLWLTSQGHNPGPADGIWGPKTDAAVAAWKKSVGLGGGTGIGKSSWPLILGETASGTGTGFALNGFPGEPEVWRDSETGQTYVVYTVPGTDIPLLWEIDEENLQAGFGEGKPIKYSRVFATTEEFTKTGGILAGDHREVVDTGQDPYLAWENTVTKQAAVRPWLADDEVLSLILEGLIENREVSLAEFQQTRWWQTHTEGEREWLLLNVSDPRTATQRLASNGIVIRDTLASFGIHEPPDSVVEFITARFTTGQWTDAEWRNQARALADPFSGIEIDAGLAAVVGGLGDPLDTTRGLEDQVRALTQRWLGPVFGDWSGEQIAEWAGRLRNDPDGETLLTEFLRSQRLGLLPNYDENLTYQDIATPWRNFVTQMWGQTADERDPVFINLLQNNDLATNSRLMREEGLKRNIGQVVGDVEGEFARSFGMVRGGFQ